MLTRLIAQLNETRASLVEQRDACSVDPITWELRSDIPDDVAAEARRLNDEVVALDAHRAELEVQLAADTASEAAERRLGPALGAPASHIRVGNEPTTYRRNGEHSYFRDLARAQGPGGNDPAARERLNRHGEEMSTLSALAGLETRANMNRTDGTGGDFVPPLWLMELYLPLARAGRVTADLCRKMSLPAGTDSINIPTVNTGTVVAEQADGASLSNTAMTTSFKNAAVTTEAGQQVFAMQLLDQSPANVDEVVFADLIADLAVRVDAYVLNKAAIGILNVTGINAVTFTSGAPTVPLLYPKVADGIQRIHTTRFLPPQAIVMHPRRWAWHLASLDASNRPLVVPNGQGAQNAFAGMEDVRSQGAVGTLQGLPVYTDPNVPINLGAGTNEDRIIEARFDDLFLWESPVRTRILFETDADTLSVRLQVWEYLAFMGNRYPAGVSVVSGTGLVTPTF